jgi:acetoin utilization protein AcuC
MSAAVTVVRDDRLAAYDFGPSHPLAPVRVQLALALAEALGVLDGVDVVGAVTASDDVLRLVHTPDYLAAVKRERYDAPRGLGTPDDPLFAGMHDAAALVAGATLVAARAVHDGSAQHAVNVAGGLHHAMPGSASGFCIYNDPAVAIAWLLAQGVERVAYVDVDVHHGDGVQAAFYDDPRVLTVSLHESGRTLFPGTGFPDETGAAGTSVNVALPMGTDDAGWLRAFSAVVPPLVHAFGPDILVTQHGCDSHASDPLAHLMLSVDGQRAACLALHDLAHEVCDGRWVAVGGGGYQLVQVVPRAWTHLLAIAAGSPLDPSTETPAKWRELARRRTGQVAPERLTDGVTPTYSAWSGARPGDRVDEAVADTRAAVFPLHGLTP